MLVGRVPGVCGPPDVLRATLRLMRRLFPSSSAAAAPGSAAVPATAPGDPEWSIEEIADEYAYPPLAEGADGAWLRGNMVASLDGAISHGGRSQPLSSRSDMWIFGVLRGLADVVVVGAQTVRLEGYRPARARAVFADRRAEAGQAPAPAIAVVSASLELDFSAPLFTEPVVPTLVVTGECAPDDRVERARAAGAEVVFAGEGDAADPARVPAALAERGLRRQLTEGGPTLLGEFAAAGVLDELCLSLSPRVTVGEAPRAMRGPALPEPDDFTLAGVLEEDGFLFTRYRRFRQSAE